MVQGFWHLIAVGYVSEILFPEWRVQEQCPGSMDINEICN
jgi:hypothetical protein